MDLNCYLEQSERGTLTDLSKKINERPQNISMYRSGAKKVPIIRCVQIEQATNGAVTRKDLRPDDYHLIWPELATQKKRKSK